jgi:putative lipoprotein
MTRFVMAALLVASCTAALPTERRIVYECGRTRMAVVFRADTALVSTGDTLLALPIAVSASGARYSDGTYTFWEHQGTALFELADTAYQGCLPSAA